jgi:Leucine-rich repeat (LRR) protein
MESVDHDRFEIRNGEIIVAKGRPDAKLVRRIARAERPQLVVNSALGFEGEDLDFLQEVGPHLVSLEVSGSFSSDVGIENCVNLEELNLNTDCRRKIDWKALPALRHLFVYSERMNSTFGALGHLLSAHVYGAGDAEIRSFAELHSLQKLTLSSCKASSLPEELAGDRLTALAVRRAPRLDNFSTISRFVNLESLTIVQCSRLAEIDFVASLGRLRSLNISENGKIRSLQPMVSCKDLETLYFYGSTTVEDGDLSVLDQLPHLTRAHFQPRRHYKNTPPQFPTVDE